MNVTLFVTCFWLSLLFSLSIDDDRKNARIGSDHNNWLLRLPVDVVAALSSSLLLSSSSMIEIDLSIENVSDAESDEL